MKWFVSLGVCMGLWLVFGMWLFWDYLSETQVHRGPEYHQDHWYLMWRQPLSRSVPRYNSYSRQLQLFYWFSVKIIILLDLKLDKLWIARTLMTAFLSENEVYAWGNNTMGQCGQGHTSTPITKPKKVLGLEGVSIQQITAGTSHSLAWTAVPTDR